MLGRVLGLLSIPLTALAIYGLVRQIRREQRLRLYSPMLGLIMAPMMLLINLAFLHQADPDLLGPALLVGGLGLGLAWGQTARIYARGDVIIGRRSILHLIFWAISYAVTQLLAAAAPATWVTGGLAAMFFSAGTSLGTNLNMLVRQLRLRPNRARMVRDGGVDQGYAPNSDLSSRR